MIYLVKLRVVAQLGSAPALGAGGRRFNSCPPDQNFHVVTVHADAVNDIQLGV
jgi:hypothetical protein